jgi:hypothetical protein
MQDVKQTPKDEPKKEAKGEDKKEAAEKQRIQQVSNQSDDRIGAGPDHAGSRRFDKRGADEQGSDVRAERKGDEGRPSTIADGTRCEGRVKE